MPMAARTSDITTHGTPMSPGPGSPTVMIGFLPAWRALPASVGPALEQLSNAMDAFMKRPVMTPADATPSIARITGMFAQLAGPAAAAGACSTGSVAHTQTGTLISTNTALTTAWTAASAVPGGLPAANQAYTEGIKAAAAAAASAVVASLAGLSDMNICPIPCPIPPHGPGFVTRGSATVIIDNLPAARSDDKLFEACGGTNPIAMGDPRVMIGG